MKSRFLVLVLLLIIVLGTFLRLYRLEELGTFLADQAIETSGARQITDGKLTLIGIKTSNSEVRNGAVMYYFLAPILKLFNFDPIAGGVLQTFLSLGAVIITFFLSPVASVFIATSALLINYSRQTMLAYYPLFFSALALYLALKIVQRPKTKLTFVLGALLGFMLQIHYLTIAIIIFALGLPLFFKEKKILFYLSLTAGFILGFSPMIVFELRHQFFNTKMLFSYLTTTSRITHPINLFSYWQEAVALFLFAGNKFLSTSLFLGLFLAYLHKKLTLLEKLCLWQLITTFLVTIIFRNELFFPIINIAHYALPAFIPLTILLANLLRRKIILIPVTIFILLINFPAYGLSEGHGYAMSPGWNLPGIKKAAQIIEGDTSNEKYNVAMIVDAQNQGIPLRYFLDSLPNPPLGVENYAQAKFLYVIAKPGINFDETHLWELDSFRPFVIQKTWNIQNGYTLHRLAKKNDIERPENFLTLVYPVRGRDLWVDHELTQLKDFLGIIETKKLPVTFLFHYDALTDPALIKKLSWENSEPGLFMEVSESLATDALVPFKIGVGHWSRPDKTFLSGYTLQQRQRIIDLAVGTFKKTFGRLPKTIGSWYLDPFSLNYLVNKYQITGYVSVADQYDTDAQRYWGKPWGVPFYPQKYNSLASAFNLKNKLDVVALFWAQRHPTDGFCPGISCSQNSLQANDYLNNKKDTNYFQETLEIYLNNPNAFHQITIGLEVGQELTTFGSEHLKQLDLLTTYPFKFVTVSQFTTWYQKTYPALSPTTTISDGFTTWVNNPCFRKGLRDNKIIDFRRYDETTLSPDLFQKDDATFLSREIPVSQNYSENCQASPDQTNYVNLQTKITLFLENLTDKLIFLRYSNLEGKTVLGMQTSPVTIFGFWQDKGLGFFEFPFQTLVRFKTLPIPTR